MAPHVNLSHRIVLIRNNHSIRSVSRLTGTCVSAKRTCGLTSSSRLRRATCLESTNTLRCSRRSSRHLRCSTLILPALGQGGSLVSRGLVFRISGGALVGAQKRLCNRRRRSLRRLTLSGRGRASQRFVHRKAMTHDPLRGSRRSAYVQHQTGSTARTRRIACATVTSTFTTR